MEDFRFELADPSAWRGGYGHRLFIRDQWNEMWVEFRRTRPREIREHEVLSECAHVCLTILSGSEWRENNATGN